MGKKPDWTAYLQKNKRGDGYLPCLRNAVAILTHSKEWHNVIAFDAFAGVIVKKKAPPWSEDIAPDEENVGDWTREDSIRAVCWLTDEYNITCHTSVVEEAVQVIAARWQIHPVRDYLNSLRWDHKKRIDDFLIRLAGAEDTPYTRAVTKNFFLSAVARVFKPGEKVDAMLILEGEQNLGKSLLFKVLASEPWFFDSAFDIGSKDSYQVLRRKWVLEWAELAGKRRNEVEKIKAFMSSGTDTYRPPYGRQPVNVPRQCVFVGTVNPDGGGYLNDPTGERRFWPVAVSKIDLRAVREERDQLWAEAVTRYRKCEPWHLKDPKLQQAAAAEAEKRRVLDPWEADIAKWLDRHDRREKGVTTEALLEKAIGMPSDRRTRADQMRVATVLRALGWTVIRRGIDRSRRYFPASPAKPNKTSTPKPKARKKGR